MSLRGRLTTSSAQYRRPSYFSSDRFPPLLAVGSGVDPYPDAFVEAWLDGRHPRPSANVAEAALGLRGISAPVATRDTTGIWTVRADAIRQLASHVELRGLREATTTTSYGGYEHGLASRIDTPLFRDAVETHLNDAAWYAPQALPPLTAAVAAAMTALLTKRLPERGRAEPVTERDYDRAEGSSDEPFLPRFASDRLALLADPLQRHTSRREWGDTGRQPQAWIDQSIAASGRVAPYRLRPLVVVTRNAGGRERAYRGWAMYEESADVSGATHVGPMVAIWAYSRSGFSEWVRIADDSRPALSWWTEEAVARLNLAKWHGFDHTWWARIHCAVSGAILYPVDRARLDTSAPDVGVLVAPVPAQTEVRDLDIVF